MDSIALQRISDNIRYLRTVFGYSQEEVATALHTCRSTYCSIENNRRIITADFIVDLANFYGVRTDTLLKLTTKELSGEIMLQEACKGNLAKLNEIFFKMSSFTQGRLLERAETLLQEERKNKNINEKNNT